MEKYQLFITLLFIIVIGPRLNATECQLLDESHNGRQDRQSRQDFIQQQFNKLYNEEKIYSQDRQQFLVDNINETSFIFVSGIFSNFITLIKNKNFSKIISSMNSFCKAHGCVFDFDHSYENGMNSSHPVAENAQIVEAMIEKVRTKKGIGRKIILVGHSKGGLEITEALLNMKKRNKRSIENIKVLTFNTPYNGTILADKMFHAKNKWHTMIKKSLKVVRKIDDLLVHNKHRRLQFVKKIVWKKNDPLVAIKDLTTANRKKYLEDHCEELKQIASKYLSVTTAYHFHFSAIYNNPELLVLAPLKLYSDYYSGQRDNDCAVTRESQRGFGDYIDLKEPLTHNSMVAEYGMQPFKGQKTAFMALLELVFTQKE